MPSRSMGARVEIIDDPRTGRSAELRLLKSKMLFFVEIDHERFENKDGDAVRKWAREKLATAYALKWIPLVKVDIDKRPERARSSWDGRDEDNHKGRCSFHARRVYATRLPNNQWRLLDWDDYERVKKSNTGHQIAESRGFDDATARQKKLGDVALTFPLFDFASSERDDDRADEYSDDVTHYVPYNDAIWLAFERLAEVIDRERKTLSMLIAHADVVARLTTIAQQPAARALTAIAGEDPTPKPPQRKKR